MYNIEHKMKKMSNVIKVLSGTTFFYLTTMPYMGTLPYPGSRWHNGSADTLPIPSLIITITKTEEMVYISELRRVDPGVETRRI
jgi:hypothetical protein